MLAMEITTIPAMAVHSIRLEWPFIAARVSFHLLVIVSSLLPLVPAQQRMAQEHHAIRG